jgi:hypothetical protein
VSPLVRSSSQMAGDAGGVEDPESGSLRPRSPLWGFHLGAGRPFRKCSSSASVPLSLPGEDSLRYELGVVGANLAASLVRARERTVAAPLRASKRSEA